MTALNQQGNHAQNPLAHLPSTHASHNTCAPDNTALFPDRFLRRPDVVLMTSLPTSTITDLVQAREFPAPYRITGRNAAWRMSEVLAWMDSRPKAALGGAV